MSAIPNVHALEWQVVKDYCEAKIAELHEENEGDLNEAETARVRGQLAMAWQVLDLAEDDEPLELIRTNNYIE